MKKIVFYSNVWGELKEWRNKYSIPSIDGAISYLQKDFDCIKVFDEKQDVYNFFPDMARLDAAVFFVPPDTYFPVQSIVNVVKMFHDYDGHVAIPHLRVNRETYRPVLPHEMNEEATAYAYNHLHYSAVNSKASQPNLWHMGIRIFETKTHYCWHHCLPTIYFSNFNQSDIDCLNAHRHLKYVWDSVFLHHVYESNRLKVIGSADFACCFESTMVSTNQEPLKENVTDAYKRDTETNKALNKFIYCARR